MHEYNYNNHGLRPQIFEDLVICYLAIVNLMTQMNPLTAN